MCKSSESSSALVMDEMFYGSCKRRFIVTNKIQKEQTGTSAHSLAGPSSEPSFHHQPRDLCQQTDLPTNLTQSCKPAAVGMFAYSGSVNICFFFFFCRMSPYSTEDDFKQPAANYIHACAAEVQYTCARAGPPVGRREAVASS